MSLIPLVPKFCLGIQLNLKLRFIDIIKTEFLKKVHSQTEFGNETRKILGA